MKTKASGGSLAVGVCDSAKASTATVLDVFAFTEAERAIIGLVRVGNTNKEIARQLCKSDETIKRQLATLMKRLRVRNRTELAHWISSNTTSSFLP